MNELVTGDKEEEAIKDPIVRAVIEEQNTDPEAVENLKIKRKQEAKAR